MSEWKEYTGSDDQIAEMKTAKNGFLLRSSDHMYENEIIYTDADFSCIDAFNVTHYLICNPHPLADMIRHQALTGQPVWIKCKESYHIHRTPYDEVHWTGLNNIYKTVTPDWNIPNAEYSFTEFKGEV